MDDILLSLCIPTNGIIEWVFPVLDSIYGQSEDESLFEVVVMDNGDNNQFYTMMLDYQKEHSNLIYKKTDAYEFLSEIETYKAASGKFIKFINHRTKLMPGTLQYYIRFVLEHQQEKPVVYFLNGALKKQKTVLCLNSFDMFVRELSYYSSWSTGMAFWKSDFENILTSLCHSNILFPHTDILFAITDRNQYIIDNHVLLDEIPAGDSPKGRYNLFHAFAVEYPSIMIDLYRQNKISIQTWKIVKKDNLDFVRSLYLAYILRKKKCSYDLSLYTDSLSIFYSKYQVIFGIPKIILKNLIHK